MSISDNKVRPIRVAEGEPVDLEIPALFSASWQILPDHLEGVPLILEIPALFSAW
jgi:hypothetical protein